MLIKITAVLIVITFTLYESLMAYGKTLGRTEILRFKNGDYKNSKKYFYSSVSNYYFHHGGCNCNFYDSEIFVRC